ncbi:MAG: S41 family peptidase [Caldilineae bacterium]|nr:MAG: S41 family peptidase [Caldilineae bacterium]
MNDNLLKFLTGLLIVALVAVVICGASFGIGLALGRVSDGGRVQALAPERPVAPDDNVVSTPRPENAGRYLDPPENFDVFWEALDRLQSSFDGDVPEGNDVTFAAIEGIFTAVGACETDVTSGADIIQFRAPRTDSKAPDNFDFFWETVNQVYADCPDQAPPPEELVYDAVHGVIRRLDDRYTDILTPRQAEDFRIDLESSFEGIGATVEPADEDARTGVVIVYPFPGSPAEQAGLKPHDEIVAVDGTDVTNMDLDDAVRLIRGPAGTTVVLTIQRSGQEAFDVEITRARIDIPILEQEIIDDKYLHISLYDFSARAESEMRQALQAGLDAGIRGVILDLRGNPGGRLDISISVASMFIEEGVIVRERSGERVQEHDAAGQALVPDLPLVVLVDGGSASASEIVAGAIQDHKRGVLIGEKTFGKGSVQTLFDLSDGSLLRVTTARWFTPNDRQIDGRGLTPDIIVPAGEPDSEEDPQLQAAIDYLNEHAE